MASVKYDKIFKLFLGSIKDYDLASLDESDAKELMTEYVHKAIATPYLSRLFSSKQLTDETETFTYTMKYPLDEDENDFVCNAISKYMVYEWSANQVNNTALTHQVIFSSKEKSFYSQQAHLNTNMSLKDMLYKEARQYVMDRVGIKNSYLGGQ